VLTIERPFLNQILNHLQACYPQEGCGLVAGDDAGWVTAVYPIHNSLQSPIAYKMDPKQQLSAMLDLEAKGWQLLAIYHSHPKGPEVPSNSDIQQAFYPEALTIIVSLRERAKPIVRIFQITKQMVTEKKMKVE
jgi:proteasome lid subunit RPN8/RPN11